jgi:serine/threonine-protein kinase HipA
MAKTVKELEVWLDGTRVADLEQRRWPEIRCRYTAEALAAWSANRPLLSCSLPLDPRPREALPFCKGLLPEGQALQAMAAEAGVAVNDSFALLERFGRDVAGALVIGGPGPTGSEFGIEAYSDDTLEEAVAALDDRPLDLHDDSELSLAGIQNKLLLVKLDKGWGRPLHGRPSTHILKADDPRYPGLVAAESLCLVLARAAGLTTIDSELVEIGETQCLVVSRYDRVTDGQDVRRIHQEDLCQALAIDPDANRGRAKYERAGGPTLCQAAELLDTYAVDPRAQLDRLVSVVAFTVAIGNADAHGKNLSLLHSSPGSVELAPLYDTVPTALWPRLRKEAAMSIGGQVLLADVTAADIVREARRWSHPEERTRKAITATLQTMLDAIDAGAIPPDSDVAAYVKGRAAELLVQVPAEASAP